MPLLALDSVSFRYSTPSVDELIAVDCKAILFYSRVSTPPRAFLNECVARGVGVCPIFELDGERANEGYDTGRLDGMAAYGDLSQIGVPDGTRLWVNMADTPGPSPLDAIADYARGFAETFPMNWLLGGYGNLEALRAAQRGSARFDKLWGVETWGSPVGSVDDHWRFWLGQPDVALVQMANVPSLAGTDTNWLIPGVQLDAWGPVTPEIVGFYPPLALPLVVNSPWGERESGFHYGVDLRAFNGDPVYALAAGDCYYAAREDGGGLCLDFKFDVPPSPGAPKYGYMHLQEFLVAPGDHVEAGQLVALADNTGQSTGSHLHVWCGTSASAGGAVDPTPWLFATGPQPPEPAPTPDFNRIQIALNAMKGDRAMAMVLYGDPPNSVYFHVSNQGMLVHSSIAADGKINVLDEVLLSGLDSDIQPVTNVEHGNVVVAVVARGGYFRRIAWMGAEGRWADTLNDFRDVPNIHPLSDRERV